MIMLLQIKLTLPYNLSRLNNSKKTNISGISKEVVCVCVRARVSDRFGVCACVIVCACARTGWGVGVAQIESPRYVPLSYNGVISIDLQRWPSSLPGHLNLPRASICTQEARTG